MTSRFWLFTVIWMIVAIAATPYWMELFDSRGIGLKIPGVAVTASELTWALLLATVPPALTAWRIRARRKHNRPA